MKYEITANKKIKSFATAHWDAQKAARSLFRRSQPARAIRRTKRSINKGISLITQTRIRSKTRRLRTTELSGGVLNEVYSMGYLRYPNSNKTLERNIMSKPTFLIGLLSLAVTFNSYAHDSDDLEELEMEIQEIKHRLSELESSPNKPSDAQEVVNLSDGWESVSNWRRLSQRMGPSDVRQILGEPHRIDGGTLATWHYENGGKVIFFNDRVNSWREP